MPTKTVKLKDATDFAVENGYLYAVYKKGEDGNYHKVEDCLWDTEIEEDHDIVVKTTGAAIDFNEFTTADGEFCFRLHNNFNVPDVIPVFERAKI